MVLLINPKLLCHRQILVVMEEQEWSEISFVQRNT